MKEARLVYGWKIGPEFFENALTQIGEEVLATGLQVVFAENRERIAFAGRPVLHMPDGVAFVGTAVPPSDVERLREGMRLAGMERAAVEAPLLWLVAG